MTGAALSELVSGIDLLTLLRGIRYPVGPVASAGEANICLGGRGRSTMRMERH